MSGQGSSRLTAKRESLSLAEVDLINSNQFKHDQQKLQRHQAKLRKDYIETMLVHNREYSELKQFLHCIKQVSKEDDEASIKSGHRQAPGDETGKKGKTKKKRGDDGDSEDDDGEDDDHDDSDESDDDQQTRKMDKTDQGNETKKRQIYLTRPNGTLRMNITPQNPDPEKTKMQPRLTSRGRIDNSPAISESTRKTTARLTALNLNAMRDQLQRISSPLPPSNMDANSGTKSGPNLRASSPKTPSHNTLFPASNQRMGTSSPFQLHPTGDRPSSRRESNAFPANTSHFSLSAPAIRRPPVAQHHSSFYPRPTSGMSDDDFGSNPVSNSFPGARRPSQSRDAIAISEGSVSSSARSASKRPHIPPKIGTKALQVLVASQKKILERRKSGENLSTRLMTPSECIEVQNRRRALMNISEEKKNNLPSRIGPRRLKHSDKSKSF